MENAEEAAENLVENIDLNQDGVPLNRRQLLPQRVVSVHFECHCRDEDIARMRAELEADPSQLDGGDDCCPPLLHAVIKEHVRCVEFLIEQGAEVGNHNF